MKNLGVGLLSFVILTTDAGAAANDGSFSVDGPGRQSCAFFVDALETGDPQASIAFGAWTEGFLTGVNLFQEDTYDITPWQTPEVIMAKMRVFCENNPDVAYVNALGRLVTTLLPNRQVAPSEVVQTRADGRAVALPLWVLEQVRGVLEAMPAGPLSTEKGMFDPEFAQRLRAYQLENDLPPTGLPDQSTLNRMFP